MSTTERIEAQTDWTEQVFKRRAVKRYSARVDMYDKTGRRQHEFTMREDWRYEVTSHAPKDGTEHWRTKMVRVERPEGTAMLWVHPECTMEELTNDIKRAAEILPEAPLEAEVTMGDPTAGVVEGMCCRFVRSDGHPHSSAQPRSFLTDSTPDESTPTRDSLTDSTPDVSPDEGAAPYQHQHRSTPYQHQHRSKRRKRRSRPGEYSRLSTAPQHSNGISSSTAPRRSVRRRPNPRLAKEHRMTPSQSRPTAQRVCSTRAAYV
jgi:hypothetical protein